MSSAFLRSAYKLRQWWANDSKVQGQAWRAAGWHVDANGVDLNTPASPVAESAAHGHGVSASSDTRLKVGNGRSTRL